MAVLVFCRNPFDSWLIRYFKNKQNLIKMSSDIYFNVASWFPGNVHVKTHFNTQCPPGPPPFTRALNYMPTQPRPIEVELRPELTTKVSCLLLGRSHIVSFFEILSRFYVRKWIKSSKELRLCQLFYWYSSQMQAKPSRKIELVNKAYLFWYWQRFKKKFFRNKTFLFSR